MGGADAAVVAARFLQLLGTVSALGALGFRLAVMPVITRERADCDGLAAELDRLVRGSLWLALIGIASRLAAQAEVITGADSVSDLAAAVAAILRFSRFGRFLGAEGVALVLALAGVGRWRASAALLVALALVLAAGSGHGAAMPGWQGRVMWGVESTHLLAAGLWLGGLAPLSRLLRRLPPAAAAAPVARFSALAMIAVAVLAASALVQGAVLVGGFAPLATTAYGRLVLAKSLLFLTLLGFGARNRLLLLPALTGANGATASRTLRRGLLWGVGFALLVLLAASVLASLPPAREAGLDASAMQSKARAAPPRA